MTVIPCFLGSLMHQSLMGEGYLPLWLHCPSEGEQFNTRTVLCLHLLPVQGSLPECFRTPRASLSVHLAFWGEGSSRAWWVADNKSTSAFTSRRLCALSPCPSASDFKHFDLSYSDPPLLCHQPIQKIVHHILSESCTINPGPR